MKVSAMIAPLCVSGNVSVDVVCFTTYACAWQVANPQILDEVFVYPDCRNIQPAPVARNKAVKIARMKSIDLLCLVDDDMMVPVGFFPLAIEFLKAHQGPAAIAVPYCCGPPKEDVLVFHYAALQSGTADYHWRMDRIPREDAARRRGIERVINIGTGCIIYDMRCFDRISHPYYDYSYDEEHVKVTETEDCYCHRKMFNADVPIYCAWSDPKTGSPMWAGHHKRKIVGVPGAIEKKDIQDAYFVQARAELRKEMEHAPPADQIDPEQLRLGYDRRKVTQWILSQATSELARTQAYQAGESETYPSSIDFVEVEDPPGNGKLASKVPQDVHGWCDFEDLYAEVVAGAKDGDTFVEVGGWQGQSAILMATLIKESGKNIDFFVVDNFKETSYQRFEANLKRYSVWDQVEVLQEDSAEAAKCFRDVSLDFVFLDAEHTFESTSADIDAWLPKIRTFGILAGHDLDFPEVERAISLKLPHYRKKGRCWQFQVPMGGLRAVDHPAAVVPPQDREAFG